MILTFECFFVLWSRQVYLKIFYFLLLFTYTPTILKAAWSIQQHPRGITNLPSLSDKIRILLQVNLLWILLWILKDSGICLGKFRNSQGYVNWNGKTLIDTNFSRYVARIVRVSVTHSCTLALDCSRLEQEWKKT